MRERTAQLIARYPYAPMVVFAAIPAFLFFIYCKIAAPGPSIAAFLGIVDFLAFGAYITLFRKDQGGSLGSSVPNIVGPWLAQMFIEKNSHELARSLDVGGGNTLVQLAFFFAGFLTMVVYMYTRVIHVRNRQRRLRAVAEELAITVSVILAVFAILAFVPGEFAPLHPAAGPILFGTIEGPGCSQLTVARVALVLWSMCLATIPTQDDAAVVSVAAPAEMGLQG
jgi:hypothetical protein